MDFRKARRLSKNDALFVWRKGCQQSEILSPSEWDLLPAQITVRIIRFTTTIRGFRHRRVTLVTSLLDPELDPAQELAALYARRWRLELCLRDLKTTLGMEQLRCKTQEMAEKELLAYLVAHNLVRCLMAEAVATHPVELERVSFKGSVDALRQFSDALSRAPNRKLRRLLWEELLEYLPPYSPDFNPIEPMWSKVKPGIQSREPRNARQLHQAADTAFAAVTPADCQGFFYTPDTLSNIWNRSKCFYARNRSSTRLVSAELIAQHQGCRFWVNYHPVQIT